MPIETQWHNTNASDDASKDDSVQSVQSWDGVPDQSANAEDALEDTLMPVG
jgi:hypothetical protein